MSFEDLDRRVRSPYGPTMVSEQTYPIMYTKHGAMIWSQREDQRLMNSYKRIPREELMRLFPDRTWMAIVSRAYILRIPRVGRWYSPEEDRLLIELVQDTELTYRQMSAYFTLRDRRSLQMRMYYLRRRQGGG